MGFTTGFTGGVVLTLGISYLTLLQHERTRHAQGSYLRSQSTLLNSILLSDPLADFPDSYDEPRTPRATMLETAKERWNQEIQNGVRAVQNADWEGVREGLEGAVARLWTNGLKGATDGAERAEAAAVPVVRHAIAEVEEVVGEKFDAAKASATRAAERTLERTREQVAEARKADGGYNPRSGWNPRTGENPRAAYEAEKARQNEKTAWEKTREVGQGLKMSEEALVDTVKETGQNVYNKASEIAKKAGGRVEDKAADVEGMLKGETDVQRALRQRYQRQPLRQKTVAELLAERYQPVREVPKDLKGL